MSVISGFTTIATGMRREYKENVANVVNSWLVMFNNTMNNSICLALQLEQQLWEEFIEDTANKTNSPTVMFNDNVHDSICSACLLNYILKNGFPWPTHFDENMSNPCIWHRCPKFLCEIRHVSPLAKQETSNYNAPWRCKLSGCM